MRRGRRFKTSGNIVCARAPMSRWLSLVRRMGTVSYLSGSRPRMTEAAEAREPSCSPERPPNRIPILSRFLLSGVTSRSHSAGSAAVQSYQFSVIREKGGLVERLFSGRFRTSNAERRGDRDLTGGLVQDFPREEHRLKS